MLAVIASGGKQHLVKTGEVVKLEKLEGIVGDKVVFDKVLLTADEDGKLYLAINDKFADSQGNFRGSQWAKDRLGGFVIKVKIVRQG
jgi:type II secretory pathway component PulC